MYEDMKKSIYRYIRSVPKATKVRWNEGKFLNDAYKYWACQEIYKLVRQNPNDNPIELIADFVTKMEEFSTYSSASSLAFSVAKDIGEDIIWTCHRDMKSKGGGYRVRSIHISD